MTHSINETKMNYGFHVTHAKDVDVARILAEAPAEADAILLMGENGLLLLTTQEAHQAVIESHHRNNGLSSVRGGDRVSRRRERTRAQELRAARELKAMLNGVSR